MSNEVPIIPIEHTIKRVTSGEVIEVEENRALLVVQEITIEAGGEISIPNTAGLSIIGSH